MFVVLVGDVDDVFFRVFADHIPRTAAESESVALADGVKPIPSVLAHFFTAFPFNNFPLLFP